MKPLRILRAAQSDLVEIRALSLSKWGLPTWEKRARAFEEAFDRIQQFPSTGQDRSEFLDRMRSVNVKPHVIFFREDEDFVVIMRVVDGRRDLPKLKFSSK